MRSALVLPMALASVFLVSSCGKKAPPPPPPPPGVFCVQAAKRDVIHSFEYVGQAVAEDYVNLVARVEGYLVKRNFEEGSIVKAGDLIFLIEQEPYKAKVEISQGNLTKAQSSMDLANIEYDRYKKLVKDNAVAQKTFDEATMQKGTAEGVLMSSKGDLDIADINLGYTEIRAPFDGKLGTCPISVGSLVGPGINTTLSKIVRIDPVKIEFFIPESIVVGIRQKAGSMSAATKTVTSRITLPNGAPYPHKGEIYFSDNEVNTSTGTLLVRARFPNTDGIVTPGQYVKVKLETNDKVSAILIPQVSIQRDQTGELVMVVKPDKTVERRQIKTGQAYDTDIEVVSGLAEGDLVISQGLMKVRPGMTVEVTMDPGQKAGEPAPAKINSTPTPPQNGNAPKPAEASGAGK